MLQSALLGVALYQARCQTHEKRLGTLKNVTQADFGTGNGISHGFLAYPGYVQAAQRGGAIRTCL